MRVDQAGTCYDLPSNRRLRHTCRRRASTAQRRELAFYSKKLSGAGTTYSTFDRELLAAFRAVRHFRFLLEGQQFRLLTDHKPLVTSLFRTTPPLSALSAATALLHRRIHLSRPHRRGLAGRGPGDTGTAHYGCHRRCAAGRLFGDGRCTAILPGGGGDDELHHTADHNPGGRRRHAARGHFDRSVLSTCAHPT
jgi:hypothetical protein